MRTLLAVSLIILILVFSYLVYAPKTEDKTYTDEAQGTESDRPAQLAPGPAADPVPEVSVESPDISVAPNKGTVRTIDLGSDDDYNRGQEALEAIGLDEMIEAQQPVAAESRFRADRSLWKFVLRAAL